MSFFCAAGPPALVYTGLPLPQLYIVLGSKSRVTATDEIFRLNIIMKKKSNILTKQNGQGEDQIKKKEFKEIRMAWFPTKPEGIFHRDKC